MEMDPLDPADLVSEAQWRGSGPDDVDLVVEVAAMRAVLAAQELERVDAMQRHALADPGRYGAVAEIVERSVRLELAAALGVTETAAGMLMVRAEALVHRYPAALESLGQARITEGHARILVELLDAAPVAVRERVTVRAVELAEELPVGSFRRALRRLLDTEQSATLTERYEHALEDRRVIIEPAADGMAWLHALLPAVEAHAIHARLTAMGKAITGRTATTAVTGSGSSGAPGAAGTSGDAGTFGDAGAFGEAARAGGTGALGEGAGGDGVPGETEPRDTRTLDQVRADILGDLLIDGDVSALAPEARGVRATVTVTVPALALLAQDDTDRHTQDLAPATVEGIGPIPLSTAKELCGGEESWMRVLTHPETGMVLSVGRTHYRPPPALRKLIRWRAERCMAPGCAIPASRCQIDHNIAWEHGGHTALDNHTPLCQGHHTIKHHGGWTIQHLHGGAILWTSPTGRQYLVKPERPTPTFRPTGATDRHTDAPF